MSINVLTVEPHPTVFPYVITRIAPAFYHMMVVPKISVDQLMKIASSQELLNGLQTCLILDENEAVYIADGKKSARTNIPSGGVVIADKLQPCFALGAFHDDDQTYQSRVEIVRKSLNNQPFNGYMFGDLSKGGRTATAEELERLSGPNPVFRGVPSGLHLCTRCYMFRGTCLDPNEQFRGQVMVVHCHCDNDNRCARCLTHFYEYKLNANYYEPRDGSIWHVPGFSALTHACIDLNAGEMNSS